MDSSSWGEWWHTGLVLTGMTIRRIYTWQKAVRQSRGLRQGGVKDTVCLDKGEGWGARIQARNLKTTAATEVPSLRSNKTGLPGGNMRNTPTVISRCQMVHRGAQLRRRANHIEAT
eukprot:EG_transcript_30227